MNFNPMDLIKIKETMYEHNSKEFSIISDFINILINLQSEQYHRFKEINIKKVLGNDFFLKQELIERAYQMAKMEFDFLKDTFLFPNKRGIPK